MMPGVRPRGRRVVPVVGRAGAEVLPVLERAVSCTAVVVREEVEPSVVRADVATGGDGRGATGAVGEGASLGEEGAGVAGGCAATGTVGAGAAEGFEGAGGGDGCAAGEATGTGAGDWEGALGIGAGEEGAGTFAGAVAGVGAVTVAGPVREAGELRSITIAPAARRATAPMPARARIIVVRRLPGEGAFPAGATGPVKTPSPASVVGLNGVGGRPSAAGYGPNGSPALAALGFWGAGAEKGAAGGAAITEEGAGVADSAGDGVAEDPGPPVVGRGVPEVAPTAGRWITPDTPLLPDGVGSMEGLRAGAIPAGAVGRRKDPVVSIPMARPASMRASRISIAVWNRRSGSFCSAFAMKASSG